MMNSMSLNIFKVNFCIFIVFLFVYKSHSSAGDRSPYFQKCVERCSLLNCTFDQPKTFRESVQLPVAIKLLWNCQDDCKYWCMWGTVDGFQNRNWRVPQFYGKWPFIRVLGVQEPASAFFSLTNLIVHLVMTREIITRLSKDMPLFNSIRFYSLVNMHAWLWSFVFHVRDTPISEFMDYVCAFSVIVSAFYLMVMRQLHANTRLWKWLFSILSLSAFLNHVIYLYAERISYSFNMTVNIGVGVITAIGWLQHCFTLPKDASFKWYGVTYVFGIGAATLLEIFDFPPIFWTIDTHALWHLATTPLHILFYRFFIMDVLYLKKQLDVNLETKQK